MLSDLYPTDDRTVPRDWAKFKSTLTYPKTMWFGVRGSGEVYETEQQFLNNELDDTSRWWIEHQMYHSEVIDIKSVLTEDGKNLSLRRIEHCPDPWKTKCNRPKYELGAPKFDLMCHIGRLILARTGKMVEPTRRGPFGRRDETREAGIARKNKALEERKWMVDSEEDLSYDDLADGGMEAFFNWCKPEFDLNSDFYSIVQYMPDENLMKIANPTYLTFVHEKEFDVLKYQEQNMLDIRNGGAYMHDGKFYTTWRMKKYGQGIGHYSWKHDGSHNDQPMLATRTNEEKEAGIKKVIGSEQRSHEVYADKNSLPFSDRVGWYPGIIGKVNIEQEDPNYNYEVMGDKMPVDREWRDYNEWLWK